MLSSTGDGDRPVQRAVDRASIADNMALYAHGVDEARYDLVSSSFVEDGVLHVPNMPSLVGRENIRDTLAAAGLKRREAGGQIFQRHSLSLSRLDINGDTASGETYFHVMTELGLDHSGRYVDRLVRCGDGWLFAERTVFVEYIQAQSRFLSPSLAAVAVVDTRLS